MKSKKDAIITTVFVFILLVGLSVALYPTFSNWWNQNMASHTISNYKESVAQMDNSDMEAMLADAQRYNEQLAKLYDPFTNYEAVEGYDNLLNVSGIGIMGYISIPNINVELPIYHGVSDSVLQIASGHIQGSSLPVGGESTHAVISGHRGLPSAKLFSDLDKIVVGDTFEINVLNEVLTYEVENIYIVYPDELDKLSIVTGEDYVTLVTCTPYGVNTHRLLVQARRIDTVYTSKVKVSADALQVDSMTVIPIILVLLIMVLLVIWGISGKLGKHVYIDKYTIDQLPRERQGGKNEKK